MRGLLEEDGDGAGSGVAAVDDCCKDTGLKEGLQEVWRHACDDRASIRRCASTADDAAGAERPHVKGLC